MLTDPPSRRRDPIPLALGAAVLLAVAAALVLTVLSQRSHARAVAAEAQHRPVQSMSDGYVSSKQCRACHPAEYESWHHSYHRTMTQVGTPEAIQADFEGVELHQDGFRYALGREGDVHWVEQEVPDGGRIKQPVKLVTGSHHMQVYWIETGRDRWLGQLPFAYMIPEKRWIPRRAAFLRPPDRPRGPETGRWNATCIGCHATHGRPRIAMGSADTRVAEFGIACEACHGPGHEHVRANTLPLRRYGKHLGSARDETIVQPQHLDKRRASEICSHCHGLWQANDGPSQRKAARDGFAYRPGGEHEGQWFFRASARDTDPTVAGIAARDPAYLDGQFWRDGMPRASSREYHGLVDSGCYENGEMTCLSCHTMHKTADDPRSWSEWAEDQLGVGMRGDAACTQCHEDIGAKLAAHTFHAPESAGSRCYDCHMPHTAYGLLKAIRQHQVSSPTVAESVDVGRPNACNLCHLDKSLGWTAAHLKERYGIESPPLEEDERTLPAAALWGLKGDAGQRVLVAWHMGWGPARTSAGEKDGNGWMLPLLASLCDDPYDAVRIVADRAMRQRERSGCDPVPRPGNRDAYAPAIVANWWKAQPQHQGPAPLFTAAGTLDQLLVDRLLREQDQTEVHLIE